MRRARHDPLRAFPCPLSDELLWYLPRNPGWIQAATGGTAGAAAIHGAIGGVPAALSYRAPDRDAAVMNIFSKPFGLIAAFIAARIGRSVFKGLWSKIDKADPPDPTTAEATFPKV